MATPIPRNEAAGTRGSLTADVASTAADTPAPRDLSGADTKAYRGIVTDSRRVEPGNLFVALRGESFDGHMHVDAALRQGAALALVERGRGFAGRADVVEVHDSLVALGLLAHAHLRRWRAEDARRRVLAITGSSGKTTTKEMTAELLAARGVVQRTQGNLNNRIGLPMTALTLDARHRFAVLEAGMSLVGEMAMLAAITEPDVAGIVNIGWAHAEGVGGIEGVAREKGALVHGLAASGVAIIHVQDARILEQARLRTPQGPWVALFDHAATPARDEVGEAVTDAPDDAEVLTRARAQLGSPPRRAYHLEQRAPLQGGGAVLRVRRAGEPDFEVRSPFVGHAQAYDFLFAWAAAEAALGDVLSPDEIRDALARVQLQGRAQVGTLPGGAWLIDDSYNANPDSMRAALFSMAEIAPGRRRVAIVGEMRELGAFAESAHDALGRELVAAKISLVIGCGGALIERALKIAEDSGVDVRRGADSLEAGRLARALVLADDLVLVKASRGVQAERAIAEMRAPG
jgi:UDP-N-acetylmuramoyl-tripeptide--D-alanyl-D-alanine ligase